MMNFPSLALEVLQGLYLQANINSFQNQRNSIPSPEESGTKSLVTRTHISDDKFDICKRGIIQSMILTCKIRVNFQIYQNLYSIYF